MHERTVVLFLITPKHTTWYLHIPVPNALSVWFCEAVWNGNVNSQMGPGLCPNDPGSSLFSLTHMNMTKHTLLL